jgi:DNA-directed RNA polymerase specialized sigma24 family protein
MHDVTETHSPRLPRLFELHHDRLVGALRARLGRYDWHLAEALAGATWLRAADEIDQLNANDADDVFEWLSAISRTETAAHYRRARSAEALTGARAYALPLEWAAEEHALARLAVLVRIGDASPDPLAVAA